MLLNMLWEKYIYLVLPTQFAASGIIENAVVSPSRKEEAGQRIWEAVDSGDGGKR